jgi:VWFA-related protein
MINRTLRGKSSVFSILVIAFSLAATLFSQTPAQKPAPQAGSSSQAPLRVATRLVQVNVIAQDGNGNPITGLTKDDFTLLDQGQSQSISFFSEERNQPISTAATAGVPSINHFSNRFAEKSGVPTSVTVILMDVLNTRAPDMAYARKQVTKFLSQLQPQDHVALYSLSSKLYILHDFTQDASALLRALERDPNLDNFRTAASEPEAADTGDAAFNSAVDRSNARAAQFYMNDRVERTALAVKVIADHISGLPGRKNLVWVSGSFPIDIIGGDLAFDHVSYSQQIEDAARSLNNANVAIYPVDARGLIANPNMARNPGPRGGGRGAPARGSNGSMFAARQNFDTMNILAERTGGRAYYNTNDIHGSVRRAIDDSRVTYVLGYYPSIGQWDGKFREIKVTVKRSGAHLRYRRGYFAIQDASNDPGKNRQLMADAVWSPLEATELGLDVQATSIDVPGARQLKTEVRISANQLRFTQSGDRWKDDLEVVWVELGGNGKALGTVSNTLNMNLPQDAYEDASRKGISFSSKLDLRDDAVEVRLVVRDGGSRAIGSVNIPLARLFGAGRAAPPK